MVRPKRSRGIRKRGGVGRRRKDLGRMRPVIIIIIIASFSFFHLQKKNFLSDSRSTKDVVVEEMCLCVN